MTSGDLRARRARALDDPVQGALDGILAEDAPRGGGARDGAAPREEAPRRRPQRGARKSSPERAVPDRAEDGALRASLDRLEETVTLLLARHAELVAGRAEAERRRAERESLDPLALRDRVRELEEERERLERHAAFLEERIRGLQSRVRYVVES